MGYTLADDYFRVDVDDRSSLYFRVSGGVRQVVATGDEARSALIQVWGQLTVKMRKATRFGSSGHSSEFRLTDVYHSPRCIWKDTYPPPALSGFRNYGNSHF
jgi:hypothetical protein